MIAELVELVVAPALGRAVVEKRAGEEVARGDRLDRVELDHRAGRELVAAINSFNAIAELTQRVVAPAFGVAVLLQRAGVCLAERKRLHVAQTGDLDRCGAESTRRGAADLAIDVPTPAADLARLVRGAGMAITRVEGTDAKPTLQRDIHGIGARHRLRRLPELTHFVGSPTLHAFVVEQSTTVSVTERELLDANQVASRLVELHLDRAAAEFRFDRAELTQTIPAPAARCAVLDGGTSMIKTYFYRCRAPELRPIALDNRERLRSIDVIAAAELTGVIAPPALDRATFHQRAHVMRGRPGNGLGADQIGDSARRPIESLPAADKPVLTQRATSRQIERLVDARHCQRRGRGVRSIGGTAPALDALIGDESARLIEEGGDLENRPTHLRICAGADGLGVCDFILREDAVGVAIKARLNRLTAKLANLARRDLDHVDQLRLTSRACADVGDARDLLFLQRAIEVEVDSGDDLLAALGAVFPCRLLLKQHQRSAGGDVFHLKIGTCGETQSAEDRQGRGLGSHGVSSGFSEMFLGAAPARKKAARATTAHQ